MKSEGSLLHSHRISFNAAFIWFYPVHHIDFFKVIIIIISIFSFWICFTSDGLLAQRLTPNLEGQVNCDRGFLPLAFDNSMSSCKVADASLVRPGYFISPVPAIATIMEEPSDGLH